MRCRCPYAKNHSCLIIDSGRSELDQSPRFSLMWMIRIYAFCAVRSLRTAFPVIRSNKILSSFIPSFSPPPFFASVFAGYLSGQSTEDRTDVLWFRLLYTVATVLAMPVRHVGKCYGLHERQQQQHGRRERQWHGIRVSQRSVREYGGTAEAQQTSLLAHHAE